MKRPQIIKLPNFPRKNKSDVIDDRTESLKSPAEFIEEMNAKN
jgi:hypothetical protein